MLLFAALLLTVVEGISQDERAYFHIAWLQCTIVSGLMF